jgi:hypothetical protein
VHDVYVALIAVGGSLLTAIIVSRATLAASRGERLEQRARDLDAALGEYLSALSQTVGEMHDMPHLDPKHPLVRYGVITTRIGNILVPGGGWVRTRRRMRTVFGDAPFRNAARLVDAASRLRVLDPSPGLANAIDEGLDYVIGLGADRSDGERARWPAIRKRTLDAISEAREAHATSR